MTRNWPLWLAIVAFVFGRQIGAQGQKAVATKFGKIEVQEIVLVEGKLQTRISPGWVRVYGERASTHICPGTVSLRADLTAGGESSTMLVATKLGAGLDVKCSPRNAASLHAWTKGAVVGVGEDAAEQEQSRSGGAQLLYSQSHGPAVEVFGQDGKVRAVLGSTKTRTKEAQAELKSPESKLTLYDKDGKLLVQLPDQK